MFCHHLEYHMAASARLLLEGVSYWVEPGVYYTVVLHYCSTQAYIVQVLLNQGHGPPEPPDFLHFQHYTRCKIRVSGLSWGD